MINESDQSSGAQNWLLNAEGGVLYHQTQGGTAGSPTSGNTWLQVARSGTSISSIAFPSSANVGIGTTSTTALLAGVNNLLQVGGAGKPFELVISGSNGSFIGIGEANNSISYIYQKVNRWWCG
jgi:hypothetical protein